ncbi:MAG: penicillin-binding protein 2 [Thermoleophilia bacterium]|nr:penicillin-binding protein 2 [Thermoleophilia bacterium]
MNRSIRRLYMALTAGFALLIGMLGYWQVVAADELDSRADNPYTQQRQREVDRGRIITADGVVLARSRAVRRRGERVYERVYPQGELAPHVIGYASPRRGATGLEAEYNRYLAGSYGTEPLLQRLRLREKRGADVRITLDTRVQQQAVASLGGRPGAVVALDPRTGAVLAIASAPSFDLNDVAGDFESIVSQSDAPLLDRGTAGRYPPGSTFKVVTATAGLATGLYTPDSVFDDTGEYVVDGRAITNSGGAKYGEHTLTQALTKSINTTFAQIGERLGPRRLGSEMTDFGFGERPGLDLPEGEVLISGRYRDGRLLPNSQRSSDPARIAIGQENLQATPLQMAMVAGAVANDGVMMRPYLMRRITDRAGDLVRQQRPEEVGRVSDSTVAQELNQMMQQVVEEGTGTSAALSGLEVAGKTGTAETGDPERNQAWFIGFAPADDPQVAVAVVVEDTSGTGGTEAAPIAADVMRAAIDARGSDQP